MKQVMGMKEGTCDERRVLDRSAESLYCTPETNVTLYVNHTGLEQKREILVCPPRASLSKLHMTEFYLKSFISFLFTPSLFLLSPLSLPDVQTSGVVG